jgi:hypothetical protein
MIPAYASHYYEYALRIPGDVVTDRNTLRLGVSGQSDGPLEIAELRIAASGHGIRTIVAQPPRPGTDFVPRGATGQLVFSFKQDADDTAKALFANVRGQVRVPNPNTIYLRLDAGYFEPPTLIRVLRKIFLEGR